MKSAKTYSNFSKIATLFLLLATGGCTKDDLSTGDIQLPAGTYPMEFTIGKDSFMESSSQETSKSCATRSTADGDWADEPTIAVKVNNELKKYQIEAGDDITQATLAVSPEEEAPFYWQSREDVIVSAWYPYTETDGKLDDELPPVVVEADQSTDENFAASDYISALEQPVQFQNPTLQFTHRTARITINLNSNVPTTGAIVRLTNLSSSDNNPSEIIAHQRAENVYEALVAPQTLEGNTLTIEIDMPNQPIYCMPVYEPIILQAGDEYTCDIQFTQDFAHTDDNTFIVYSYEGLLAWCRYLEASTELAPCILGADIVCPTVPDGESNWIPTQRLKIADMPYQMDFIDNMFDGNGHSISGMTIISDEEYVGMFQVNWGEIRNLRLENVKIVAPNAKYVGGIVGRNKLYVDNCSVSGTINGQEYVGGIVGENVGEVRRCTMSATVQGQNYVGGIVGKNNGYTEDSHASGTVSGNKNVGGIAGSTDVFNLPEEDRMKNDNGDEYIPDSFILGNYSLANISGQENVGGVVGTGMAEIIACYAQGNVTGQNGVGGVAGTLQIGGLNACYHFGAVSGADGSTGGVVGTNIVSGTITACYWNGTVTGGKGIGSGSGTATEVDGTNVNWDDTIIDMNNVINTGNWRYFSTGVNTPPILIKN